MIPTEHTPASWYREWLTRHATAFSFTERQIQTALSWWPALGCKYSAEELHAVTNAMILLSQVYDFDQMRAAIVARAEDARKLAKAREAKSFATQPAPEAERLEIRKALRQAGLVTTPLEPKEQ